VSKTPVSKTPQDPDTTGHSWDGIQEFNNPLPRWWLWTFYATIFWGLVYTILFPAWPLVSQATPGMLSFSTRENARREIQAVVDQNAALTQRLESVQLASIADDQELYNFAINAGGAVFRNNCSQCHGSGAQGAVGYPNLLDNDWLWGGTLDEIAFTVTHGIRNEQSPDTRWSQMPAFGEILTPEEITAVVQHLLAISGQEHDAALAATGQEVFLNNCAACHMDDGTGDRAQGAPNLTDAIWLYGGDVDTLTQTVNYARFGVMPAWLEEYRPGQGLTKAEINAVAAYVHSRGGGE
jgi:cytochrome c oxidase cbb3-type subunit III